MSFFEFPHTRTYDDDLGWVIAAVKALKEAMETFIGANTLTFADPLLHDITTQYNKNTIVLDSNGNAYLSIKIVPAGINLSNTEYWLMIFDYEAFLEKVNKNFTSRYYRNENRAKTAMIVGDWLTFDDVLCKVTAAIAVDDVIEEGTNIEAFTLEDFIKAFMTSANQMIQQYKNDIDESERQYVADMQAEVDRILAGATVDSEVIDARLGWNGTNYPTLGQAIRTQITDIHDNALMRKANHTGSGVDFNDFTIGWGRVYSTTSPLNSPVVDPYGIVFTTYDVSNADSKTQLYVGYNDGFMYIRFSTNDVWGNWKQLTDDVKLASTAIFGGNLTGAGVDFNNLAMGWYRIYSTTSPLNSPVTNPFGFVICLTDHTNPNSNYKTQIYIAYRTTDVFIRFYTAGTWEPWHVVGYGTEKYRNVVTINPGDDLYTIIQGLASNTHVIINAGTYDISAQMEALPDSYSTDMHIKSTTWIEGRGDVKIICNLSTKRSNNSVFMFDTGGYLSRISGLHIEATNTRYVIHDDVANNVVTNQWTHLIENCHIKYTGIVGGQSTDGRSIGGGMGVNVTNIIKDCIFEDTNYWPVDYHTNSAAINDTVNGPSKVVIANNYFVAGSARCRGLSEDTATNRDIVEMYGNHGTTAFYVNNPNNTIIPMIWNNDV